MFMLLLYGHSSQPIRLITDDVIFVVVLYRELVSGVETLKNVADILQFIDSISEIKDQRTK